MERTLSFCCCLPHWVNPHAAAGPEVDRPRSPASAVVVAAAAAAGMYAVAAWNCDLVTAMCCQADCSLQRATVVVPGSATSLHAAVFAASAVAAASAVGCAAAGKLMCRSKPAGVTNMPYNQLHGNIARKTVNNTTAYPASVQGLCPCLSAMLSDSL